MRKILLLLIFGILSGCGREKMNTENKLDSIVNKGFYFEMDNNKVDSLLKKLETIKINDSISVVLRVLGKPDYDELKTKKENNEFVFREFKYYIKKKKKELALGQK